jgi:GNAT superfamily N-acetyltransferase
MAVHVEIEVRDSICPEDDSLIRKGLGRHNKAAGPFDEIQPLRCFARNESGQLVGGAVGHAWGACAELGQLWVEESNRRRGLGSRLLARFEVEASARGCTLVYFDTFSFNAPEFYATHRYEIACKFEGLPGGAAHYIMRKLLEPAA